MTPPESGWSKSLVDCNEKIVIAYPIVRGKFRDAHPDCDLKLDYTYRSPELQFQLFQKGRKLQGDQWVISDPKAVVTQLDGFTKKAKHNAYPSDAADIYIIRNGSVLWCEGPDCEEEVALYQELGDLWIQQGLISGARWPYNWKDYDHVQVGFP